MNQHQNYCPLVVNFTVVLLITLCLLTLSDPTNSNYLSPSRSTNLATNGAASPISTTTASFLQRQSHVVDKCPEALLKSASCKCHYSQVCTYPSQRECFLMHCTQLRRDSELSEQLAHFSGVYATVPIDLIISASNILHFGYGNEEDDREIMDKKTEPGAADWRNISGSWTEANIAGLRMYHNNITNISALAFTKLAPKLSHFSVMERAHDEQTRNIDYNQLVRSIRILVRLSDIFISVYRIRELDFNVYRYFPELKSLSVICTKLDSLLRSVSYEFTALTNFMLQSNINHFPNYVFWRMPNLKEITFISGYYGIIQKKDFSTLSLAFLESLSITYTPVELIEDDSFVTLNSLKRLTLRENRIRTISRRSFSNLTKLEFLDLSWNQIDSLHPEAFADLRSLLILKLDKNKLGPVIVFETFNSIATTLQSLTLAHNKLQVLPVDFINTDDHPPFPELIDLDVSFNEITHLPEFTKQQNGGYLAENSRSPGLKFFDVSHNHIQTLPSSFMRLFWQTLSKFDVSSNKLLNVTFSIFDTFQNLTYLDLSDNRLTRMKKIVSIFGSAPDLLFLGLKGNPWVCDCDTVSFLDWHSEWSLGLSSSSGKRQTENWEKVKCLHETSTNEGGISNVEMITTMYDLFNVDEAHKFTFCPDARLEETDLPTSILLQTHAKRIEDEQREDADARSKFNSDGKDLAVATSNTFDFGDRSFQIKSLGKANNNVSSAISSLSWGKISRDPSIILLVKAMSETMASQESTKLAWHHQNFNLIVQTVRYTLTLLIILFGIVVGIILYFGFTKFHSFNYSRYPFHHFRRTTTTFDNKSVIATGQRHITTTTPNGRGVQQNSSHFLDTETNNNNGCKHFSSDTPSPAPRKSYSVWRFPQNLINFPSYGGKTTSHQVPPASMKFNLFDRRCQSNNGNTDDDKIVIITNKTELTHT